MMTMGRWRCALPSQGLEAVGVKDAAAADIKEPNDAHGLR